MSIGPKIINDIEAFHCKYIVNEETGCWQWIGYISPRGYGQFRFNKKNYQAHRFSYEYFIGDLKDGLVICHICNNTKCVNPKHLRQDTQKSNMIDRTYAEKQHTQKLSVEMAKEIKIALKTPYLGINKDLSIKYGVAKSTISQIKNDLIWSHIKI